MPRIIGTHPETGQPIEAGINRYGPYIKHDRFVRLGPGDDVLTIGMNRAMALLDEAKSSQRAGPRTLKEVGPHPKDKKPVTLHQGRFGHYVKHGRTNASLPKGKEPDDLNLEEAVALLAQRAGKGKSARAGKAKSSANGQGPAASAKGAKRPRKAAPGGKAAGTKKRKNGNAARSRASSS